MADLLCDKRPCASLAQVITALDLDASVRSMRGPAIVTNFSKSSAQPLLRVTLRYCPFCGMQLDEDIARAVSKARGSL